MTAAERKAAAQAAPRLCRKNAAPNQRAPTCWPVIRNRSCRSGRYSGPIPPLEHSPQSDNAANGSSRTRYIL